jgi:hypothetical protein
MATAECQQKTGDSRRRKTLSFQLGQSSLLLQLPLFVFAHLLSCYAIFITGCGCLWNANTFSRGYGLDDQRRLCRFINLCSPRFLFLGCKY